MVILLLLISLSKWTVPRPSLKRFNGPTRNWTLNCSLPEHNSDLLSRSCCTSRGVQLNDDDGFSTTRSRPNGRIIVNPLKRTTAPCSGGGAGAAAEISQMRFVMISVFESSTRRAVWKHLWDNRNWVPLVRHLKLWQSGTMCHYFKDFLRPRAAVWCWLWALICKCTRASSGTIDSWIVYVGVLQTAGNANILWATIIDAIMKRKMMLLAHK